MYVCFFIKSCFSRALIPKREKGYLFLKFYKTKEFNKSPKVENFLLKTLLRVKFEKNTSSPLFKRDALCFYFFLELAFKKNCKSSIYQNHGKGL